MLENNALEFATLLLFYKYTTLVSTVKVSPLPGLKEQTLTVLDSHSPLYGIHILWKCLYNCVCGDCIAISFLAMQVKL